MDRGSTMFFACLGIACIYAGYRLFCGLPLISRSPRTGYAAARVRSLILLNVVPGALLALFGAAVLTTEVRGMLVQRPALHRESPAAVTSGHRNRASSPATGFVTI